MGETPYVGCGYAPVWLHFRGIYTSTGYMAYIRDLCVFVLSLNVYYMLFLF